MNRTRRDPYKLHRLRQIVQLIFLLVFVFLLVKASLGRVLGSSVPLLIMIFITATLTLLLGRVLCGWVCPVNTVLDRVHFKGAVERGARIPEGWRAAKYVLLLLILIVATFIPLGSDSVASASRASIGSDNQNLIVGGGILVLALAAVVGMDSIAEHFWCRYLCPVGGAVGLLSKVAPMHRIVRSHCNDCSVCVDACPMGTVDPRQAFTSDPSECTVCLDCMTSCTSSSNGFAFSSPMVFFRHRSTAESRQESFGRLR